jgi:PAS domain S-box-containing protein
MVDLKGRFIKVNKRLCEMLGYSEDELLSRTFSDITHPDDIHKGLDAVAKHIAGADHLSFEKRYIHKQGHIINIIISPSLIRDRQGDPLYFVGLWQDITKRRRAEEELGKSREHLEDLVKKRTGEAMQAAHLASLGELAAGVAHEINNPVNGIINYAEILVNKMGKGSREHDIAGRIIKEGVRIAGIVSGLLSFGRENKDEKKPVRVNEILSEILSLTSIQLEKNGIHLTIDNMEYVPEVYANPQQLQQVFLNVISNARHALNQRYPDPHKDKRIEIRSERVICNDTQLVRIGFIDYGTGIPSDLIDRVTNPFFTTKPAGQGTGLGLSISRGIIEHHGGRLKVESEEGKFTRVLIDLPFTEKGPSHNQRL